MTPDRVVGPSGFADLALQDEFDQARATALADVPLEEAQRRLLDVVWKPRGKRAWALKPMAYSGLEFAEHVLDRWAALSRTPPRRGRRSSGPTDPLARWRCAASVREHLTIARPGADAGAIARELGGHESLGSYATLKRRLQRLATVKRVPERFADDLFTGLGRPELLHTVEPWHQDHGPRVSARERRAYSPGFPYETLTGGRRAWIPELIDREWLVVDDAGTLRRGPRFAAIAAYDAYVREWRERTGRPPVDDDLAS
jgi:hypothetical protein